MFNPSITDEEMQRRVRHFVSAMTENHCELFIQCRNSKTGKTEVAFVGPEDRLPDLLQSIAAQIGYICRKMELDGENMAVILHHAFKNGVRKHDNFKKTYSVKEYLNKKERP